jgi:hypothetical protein
MKPAPAGEPRPAVASDEVVALAHLAQLSANSFDLIVQAIALDDTMNQQALQLFNGGLSLGLVRDDKPQMVVLIHQSQT